MNEKPFMNLKVNASRLALYTAAILLAVILFSSYTYLLSQEPGPVEAEAWYDDWTQIPEHYKTYMSVTGPLRSAPFPVEWSGAAPPANNTGRYLTLDALYMEKPGNPARYYLHVGGRSEMLLADTWDSSMVGEATVDEIVAAYRGGLNVTVSGFAYKVRRLNQTYTALHVENLAIHGLEEMPLTMYHVERTFNRYSEPVTALFSPTIMPVSFKLHHSYASNNTVYLYAVCYTSQIIRFNYTASGKVALQLLVHNIKDTPSWGPDGGEAGFTEIIGAHNESLAYEFTVPDKRLYLWKFYVWNGEAEVIFDNVKEEMYTEPVLFYEDVSTSTPVGGMSLVSVNPSPLPESFAVNRTRSGSGFSDRSYRFESYFARGELLRFGYNASEPVEFRLYGPGREVTHLSVVRLGYGDLFKVPASGQYTFSFSVYNQTADVSFRCDRLDPDSYFFVMGRVDIPVEQRSALGILKGHILLMNTKLPDPVDRVPYLMVHPQDIEYETARSIAVDVFRMDPSAMTDTVDDLEERDTIAFKQGSIEAKFYGLDRITFSTGARPSFKVWNRTEAVETAEELLEKMSAYWVYPTEARLVLEEAKPSLNSSEPAGDFYHEIGVRYKLWVGEAALMGPEVRIWVAGDRVLRASLYMLSVSTGEAVEVARAPEDALGLFIGGMSDTRSFGSETIYGPLYANGICIIDGVRLVYHLGSYSNPGEIQTLYYEVSGRIKFWNNELDTVHEARFQEYLIATGE